MDQTEDFTLTSDEILAARREARKKKILENSNKRLGLLTGKEHNEPPLAQTIYPDPDMERETPDRLVEKAPSSWLHLFLRTQIQFRLLGTLFYILFACGIFPLSVTNVFMAVLGWEMVEIFVFRVTLQPVVFFNLALMMSGLPKQQIVILTKFVEAAAKISKDMALFMQAFALTHFMYCKAWLRLDLETIFYAGILYKN